MSESASNVKFTQRLKKHGTEVEDEVNACELLHHLRGHTNKSPA